MIIYIDARGGDRRTQLMIEDCLQEAGQKGWRRCVIDPDYLYGHLVGFFLVFSN